MIKTQSALPINPFEGRDSKEVWKELLVNSISVDKVEFMKKVETYFSSQSELHSNKK